MNLQDIKNNLSISVCIATHERASLLEITLEKIARQVRHADEIVISDSSITRETERIVSVFQYENPNLLIKYIKSECKALPWHRWNGFQHSTGQIVFFMDDDITLAPRALEMLEKSYFELFSRHGVNEIAGIGFYITLDDGSELLRHPDSFEERWLGTSFLPSASITAGGLGIPAKSMPIDTLKEAGRLSGGGMSFRREVLEKIGLLDGLIDLFNHRIGPSEDTVLSYHARQFGRLFMITYHMVFHPRELNAVHTVDSRGGWHRGMLETWGRAHTMRWMSSDERVYRYQWLRVATLEILRAFWWGILRKPFSSANWSRLAGGVYGFLRTLLKWNTIPSMAKPS